MEVDGKLVNVPQYLVSSTGGVAAGDTYILNPAYATATNDGGRSLPGFLGSAPPCPEGLNMFGITELSESCREFLQIHPKSYTKLEQNIVEANVQGAEAAYDAVKPILQKKTPALVAELDAKFAAVYAALAPYKTGTTYVAYTALTKDDTRTLSQAIDSLAEPLSKVSKQVVGS